MVSFWQKLHAEDGSAKGDSNMNNTCLIHDHCHSRIEAQSKTILKMKELLMNIAFHQPPIRGTEVALLANQLLKEEGFIAEE